MRIDVFYLNCKELKSKNGGTFYLATFIFNGEPFKIFIKKDFYNYLKSVDSMSNVTIVLDCNVYNDRINLVVSDIN